MRRLFASCATKKKMLQIKGPTETMASVGRTGPESILMYYKELNSRIDAMTNETTMSDIAIKSVNYRKAWKLAVEERHEELSDYLAEKVICLKNSGAEVISLTVGTMHIVYDKFVEKSGVPLISIPKAVSEKIVSRSMKRVGLLGSIFTIEKDYMKKDMIAAGI